MFGAPGRVGAVGRLGLAAGQATGFDMRSFFAGSEPGLIYDIQNISSLRQDLAGTVPAAVGSSVALITDLSGRGNHARMTTAINRPILRQDANGFYFLQPNGTSSWMVTDPINFTGTDKVTVFAGIRKANDSGTGIVAELGPSVATNPGGFALVASAGDPPRTSYGFRSIGSSALLPAANTPMSYPAGTKHVVTGVGDIANDICRISVNNDAATTVNTDQGSGSYGNSPVYLFSRGGTSVFSNADMYYLAIRGALCDATQTANARASIARKMGVTL